MSIIGTNVNLPLIRSVIVRTGADEYREIFYGQPVVYNAGFSPTKIVSASEDQTLVWFRADTGGNRHPMADFLFRIDSSGSARVDLDPVLEVANSILPANGELNIWAIELLARATHSLFERRFIGPEDRSKSTSGSTVITSPRWGGATSRNVFWAH